MYTSHDLTRVPENPGAIRELGIVAGETEGGDDASGAEESAAAAARGLDCLRRVADIVAAAVRRALQLTDL